MANEIRTTVQINVSKNGQTLAFPSSVTNDMSGDVIYMNTQTVGTSTEQIAFPADLSGTPSFLVLKNLDTTNYIEIGLNTPLTQIFAKIKPGQSLLLPCGTATYYALANTAACKIVVIVTSA